MADVQDGKCPANKKNGKLISIPIIVKERIRDRLIYMIGDLGTCSCLNISPAIRLGSNILISNYSLNTAYMLWWPFNSVDCPSELYKRK